MKHYLKNSSRLSDSQSEKDEYKTELGDLSAKRKTKPNSELHGWLYSNDKNNVDEISSNIDKISTNVDKISTIVEKTSTNVDKISTNAYKSIEANKVKDECRSEYEMQTSEKNTIYENISYENATHTVSFTSPY